MSDWDYRVMRPDLHSELLAARLVYLEGLIAQLASRAAIDDMTADLAHIVRPRIFTVTIYSPSDSVERLVRLRANVIEVYHAAGYKPLGLGKMLADGSYGAVLFVETPEPETKDGMLKAISTGFKDTIGEALGKGIATGAMLLVGGVIGVSLTSGEADDSSRHETEATAAIVFMCPEGKELDFTTRAILAKNAKQLREAMEECHPVGRFPWPDDRDEQGRMKRPKR
jgi:hypothetical protein